MSIQDIISKIIKKAEEEADIIINNAKKEAENVAKKIDQSAAEKREQLLADVAIKSEKAIKKSKYLGDIEGKNDLLRKKREFIENILDKVLKKLAELDEVNYKKLLLSIIKKLQVKEGTVYPAKNKTEMIKKVLKNFDETLQFGEPRDITGGFIIETSQVNFDFSWENVVKKIFRKDLETIIVSELFE